MDICGESSLANKPTESTWYLTSPYRKHVFVPLCNHKAALGALSFKHRIGASSCAVMYVLKLAFPVVLLF